MTEISGLLAQTSLSGLKQGSELLILGHIVLVGLDHLLHHLAAHGTGLLAGQVAVVALLQVDTDLPWCIRTIL